MKIFPDDSSLVAEFLCGSDDGSVALAKFKTRDSAPPMPRSRWMNTTSGCFVMARVSGHAIKPCYQISTPKALDRCMAGTYGAWACACFERALLVGACLDSCARDRPAVTDDGLSF